MRFILRFIHLFNSAHDHVAI